ncbi:hypothetical protein [Desulfovibrio sp.]|uniref:hypothetical protein n=1 Tax=Desulfovibrio sp. TaxID=885 RepID=UPI0025C4899A|nr:hypothetical protein [Desulfovibrio sp.]
MVNGQNTLHQVEIKVGDARNSSQLFANKSFFHGAVHIHDAVDGTGIGSLTNGGEINWRCFSVVMTAATAVPMNVVLTVSMGRFMRMVMFRMILVARFAAGVFVNFLSMVVGTTA